jgi:hypothetical protein
MRTFINLFLAGALTFERGSFDQLAAWDPALRLLHAGIPVYDPARADFRGRDPRAVLTLDDTDDERQADALSGLYRIDGDEFHKQLIAVLGNLSTRKVMKLNDDLYPSYHTCIAHVVGVTDNAKVWAAVGKYLAAADPEVKLEWMEHFTRYVEQGDRSYPAMIGCVAGLLTDEAVKVTKNGNDETRTEVRNLAAIQHVERPGIARRHHDVLVEVLQARQ